LLSKVLNLTLLFISVLIVPMELISQSEWSQDVDLTLTGWLVSDAGWWEELEDICPWGDEWAAAAVQVYNENGSNSPALYKWNEYGFGEWLFPFNSASGQVQIKQISVDGDHRLWCGTNIVNSVNDLTSTWGIWILNLSGDVDSSLGDEDTPGLVQFNFGSSFQELHGFSTAVLPDSQPCWMATGMVLDPCCFHKEMPALLMLDSNGNPLSTFGDSGRVIVDVSLPGIADTLGISLIAERHNLGGVYMCGMSTEGGLIAAGAYSNSSHYEVMVAKHHWDGTLDENFGTEGMVHLNLNPGINHWIERIVSLADGSFMALVVSHDGGDLPSGWHWLIFDQDGSPVHWETYDPDAAWKSVSFIDNFPTQNPVGFGFLEMPGTGTLLEANEDWIQTPEPLAMQPEYDLGGNMSSLRCIYHPEWERLLLGGLWEPETSFEEPQLAISHWQHHENSQLIHQDIFPSSYISYPNPSRRGSEISIIGASNFTCWSLFSLTGHMVHQWRTIKSITPLSLKLPTGLPSGTYLLRTCDASQKSIPIVIE
jgi:hypothetical protein